MKVGSKYDVMLIDESQDTAASQQWIAVNSAHRLVVIGDRNQAIYGFRGAGVNSIDSIKDELKLSGRGVIELPLTVTRRCPKSHVELAQRIVPGIRALDDAIDGEVNRVSTRDMMERIGPGDLVLCRVNAELLGVAYKLLKRGVKAVVRGRDIGKGIEGLVKKAKKSGGLGDADQARDLIEVAGELTDMEIQKYLAIPRGKGAMRASNCQDRYDCLVQVSEDAETVGGILDIVEKLFADFDPDGKPNNAVVLGTVHRTKGLESDRVWVLRPDLLPHPMARQEWEQGQERNLAYVAVTRGRKELNFVGGESVLFGVE
jgi:superfamily I DNA/RNA helicase